MQFILILCNDHAICLLFLSWRAMIRGSTPKFYETTRLSWWGCSIICRLYEFVWLFQVLLVVILWLHYLGGTIFVHRLILFQNFSLTYSSRLLQQFFFIFQCLPFPIEAHKTIALLWKPDWCLSDKDNIYYLYFDQSDLSTLFPLQLHLFSPDQDLGYIFMSFL